ncbi:MAG: uroporphyrinogen-III C-methyltransferase [Gammaproteobacteria bacterium]
MTPNEVSPEPRASAPAAAATVSATATAPATVHRTAPAALWVAIVLAVLVAAGALYLAWQTQQRLQSLEQELVRRQQGVDTAATEARLLAQQAQDAARDAAARVALVDARVAEVAVQRTQVDELVQSLSRSRDDNVLADVEAALRLAARHAAMLGSAEPLGAALKQADERLAALKQPRVERVRRALARDLERLGAARMADVDALSLRLDEVLRQVDELPMLALVEPRRSVTRSPAAVPPTPAASAPAGVAQAPAASAPVAAASGADGWFSAWPAATRDFALRVWTEVRTLLRVTRIDDVDPMLLTPEQAFFMREQVKLRLLSARLSLLARQFELAQADLRAAQALIERHFDPQSRRVQAARETLRQVAQQSRDVELPRPDETLAALAAATR